jgi:hypothetical protein
MRKGVRITMMVRLNGFARRHPALFFGAWFAVAALLLASPLGTMMGWRAARSMLGVE